MPFGYLGRRLLHLGFVLLGVSLVVFLMLRMIPGDPARLLLGEFASAEDLARLRAQMGLERPLPVQYGLYLGRLLQGDLGQSLRNGAPVAAEIAQRLAATVELAVAAMLIATFLGIAAGVVFVALAGSLDVGLFQYLFGSILTVTREDVAVIVLTAYHDDEQMLHAIRAGGSAYFPKDVDPQELIRAIHEVHRGNYVLNDAVLAKPQVASWLLHQFEQMPTAGLDDAELTFQPLSTREMEILTCITHGKSNKEIASDLGISIKTVAHHRAHLMEKVRAVNAADLVRMAMVAGVLSAPPA